jgi:phenylpropionate dioxygenase-like ring-hydroxylating dioxygenase large terminal subunit
VDASVYRDPARHRLELERIFFQCWLPVAPSSDMAGVGDYVVWDQMGQSIVITRGRDGRIAAWHNVCQHRGSRVVEASGHCSTGKFKCPWHGFVYDMYGSVEHVPLPDTFDQTELAGLRAPAVRATEWSGWIWLTMSDQAPTLQEYLGDIADELSGYANLGFEARYRSSVRLNANWKAVVDSFNETWHVPFTHKDTLSGMVMWRDAALRIAQPHSWMTLPIRGFTENAGSTDHRKSHLCHYLAFPNTIFSCFPTHLHMWSAWPVSPSETLLCAYEFVGAAPPGMTDERWSEVNDRNWEHFLAVLAEDSKVINDLGTVVDSLGYRRNMFNTAEGRLTAFHEEVARRVS